MLTDLYIKDLVLIHQLHISLSNGLSSFSGETGAGKSILLDALALSLGKRADISLIRKGCDQTSISAVFLLPQQHPALEMLKDLSLLNDDNPLEVVLRRTLNTKGVSKAYINDTPVNVATLKKIGDQLLEIHGQFDHLLDAKMHRKLLDQSIVDDTFKQNLTILQNAYKTYKDLQEQLDAVCDQEKNQLQQQFMNQTIIDELSSLQLLENEEAELLTERQNLDALGKSGLILQKAYQLSQDPTFTKELRFLLSKIGTFSVLDHLKIPLERIESDLLEVFEIAKETLQSTQEAQQRLEAIDDRLYVLRAKAKKFGVDTPQLLPLLENAQQKNAMDYCAIKQEIEDKINHVQKDYLDTAKHLTKARQTIAKQLQEQIYNEFLNLKLPHARFHVAIESDEKIMNQHGIDRIEFMISTNKEQDLTPLTKTASGGEMARVMLALKCILSQKTELVTLVFDEIETGVGGAVASAIGQRMLNLSKSIQVLSITHAPQIAACANHNYYVQKSVDQDVTQTTVRLLNFEEKILEVARMLSGESLTENAIEAAKDLCQ
ncbi:MAG: DNA repair protein RecN [Holosporales bacterium]